MLFICLTGSVLNVVKYCLVALLDGKVLCNTNKNSWVIIFVNEISSGLASHKNYRQAGAELSQAQECFPAKH